MAYWYLILHLVPLVVLLTLIVFLTVRRWRWRVVDLIAVLLPGWTWLYLVAFADSQGKSLANFVELPLLAIIVAALAFAKPQAERTIPAPFAKYAYLLLTTAAAVALFFLFPDLDE